MSNASKTEVRGERMEVAVATMLAQLTTELGRLPTDEEIQTHVARLVDNGQLVRAPAAPRRHQTESLQIMQEGRRPVVASAGFGDSEEPPMASGGHHPPDRVMVNMHNIGLMQRRALVQTGDGVAVNHGHDDEALSMSSGQVGLELTNSIMANAAERQARRDNAEPARRTEVAVNEAEGMAPPDLAAMYRRRS